MKTPDLTPAQLLAFVTWAVAQLVAFGVVDDETRQIMLSGAGTILPAVWAFADAIIRHGRSRAIAAPPKEPSRDAVV